MEVNGGGGDSRVYGCPSSRIVRVSKVSGGKDRHSKVVTSKGLRDRRVRLSVSTAIQFYDLQDRLGYDQPSKAVEWLIKAAADSINELPSLDPSSFHDSYLNSKEVDNKRNKPKFVIPNTNTTNNNNSSSNSETSKGSGSGLSLTRCENRIKARERARIMASKKENEKSFTDLLATGISSTTSPMDYFCATGDNLNFASSSFCGGGGSGFNRGTLQSNLMSSLPYHHQQVQRFQQSSMVDGPTSTNFPFFVAGAGASGHFLLTNGYEYRGGDGEGRYSDYYKETSKNHMKTPYQPGKT